MNQTIVIKLNMNYSYRSIIKFSVSDLIDLIIDVTIECAFPRRISSLTYKIKIYIFHI